MCTARVSHVNWYTQFKMKYIKLEYVYHELHEIIENVSHVNWYSQFKMKYIKLEYVYHELHDEIIEKKNKEKNA